MVWFDIPDELLPPVYRNIKDMYAYARSLDTELRNLLVQMGLVQKNFFIQECDAQTLQDWIALLRIPLYGGEAEQEKRDLVLLYLNNQKPASEPYFRYMLEELFGPEGYKLEIDPYDPLTISIDFIDARPLEIRRFGDWFVRMVPAHIAWLASLVMPSECIVNCTNTSLSTDFATCVATSSMGQNATLYLGQNSTTADWIDLG